MISIVCSTKKIDVNFKKELIKTSGLHKNCEILMYENDGSKSLTEVYNKGLKDSKNDIVVFLHDDIEIKTKNWAKKLLKHYEKNVEYGILGVAGSKALGKSGKWWEDFTKMYGKVYHTKDGKTWLSKYSEDQDNKIEPVALVDGVFFSVHKKRIKKNFNEEYKNFHFYDVEFCFNNFINDVKIGVHTNILINHMSIGETNDHWEENRKQFVEEYSKHLPVKVKKSRNNKIKVLIGCLNFNSCTGSEMYTYELAKELLNQNCDVTICSNIGGEISRKIRALGCKLANLNQPPGYKVGDGKWGMKNRDGETIISEKNKLYRVTSETFDILHLSHKPVVEHLMKFYPNVDVISTIHSEVIDLENPIIDDRIKTYIAIRPEIKDHLINEFNIDESKIKVIYNPIDTDRFQPRNNIENKIKRTLFVGTIDYLRNNTLNDLVTYTRENNRELWIVGKENGDFLGDIMNGNSHVKHFPATWNVEKYIKDCDETAGILLGRTTIEGWLCDKPGWIYNVDSDGNILNKKLHEVPKDVDRFYSDIVADKIIDEYINII